MDRHLRCSRRAARVFVAVAAIVVADLSVARAAAVTWGSATTGTWATAANWLSGTAPTNNTTTDTAVFASTNAARTVTLGADTSITGITFTNTNSTSFVNDGTLRTLSIGSSGLTLNGTSGNVSIGSGANPINLVLASGQTYTNNSTVGTLTITGTIGRAAGDTLAKPLTVTGSGNTVFTGELVNGGASSNVGLTKNGSGTLTFNGSGTSTFSNTTTLNAGVLMIDFVNSLSGTNVFSASSTVNVGGGSMTIKGKSSGATSQTLAATTITGSSAGALLVDPNGGTSTTVNLAVLTTNPGSAFLIGRALGSGTGSLVMTTTTGTANNGIYVRTVYASGTADTGYDFATSAAGTPRTLSGFNAYSSLPSSGSNVNVSQLTASTSLSGNLTTNSLKVANPAPGQSLAIGGNVLTLTGGGLLFTGSNAFEISGNAGGTRLTTGSGNGTTYELIVHQYSSGAATISAPIGDNGSNAVALTKAGPGTLVLSGSNTYTGPTVVTGGVLAAGASGGAFGSNSAVTVANGGTLRLGGFSNAVGSLSGTTGATVENANVNAATLTFSGNNTTSTFGGLLRDGAGGGALSLVKNGSGQVTLSAANTFTGGVTINSGTFVAGAASALGTGTVTLSGGVLRPNAVATTQTASLGNPIAVSGSGTVVFPDLSGLAGAVTGGASDVLTFESTGRTTNTSNFSGFSGTLVLNSGGFNTMTTAGRDLSTVKLSMRNNASLGSGDVGASFLIGELSGEATNAIGGGNSNAVISLTVGQLNTSSTFAGSITNTAQAASLGKVGTGMLTLSGTNSYTGATTGSAGVLRLGSQFALPGGLASSITGTSSNLTIAGGVIGLGFDNMLRPLGTGSAAVQWSGTSGGFAAYGAARTVNLGGSGATVTWGSGNFVPTNSALILSHTTADNTITFANGIDLGASARTIQVARGTVNGVDAIMSGSIAGAGGGLVKTDVGTLSLTGTNTFSGATTISAGILSIAGTSGLQGTSGVTIAGGAGLTYAGAADTFAKNITVTAGSGTGTVTNSGGGLLTLSGTLSKNNSVLRLTGGSFNVTGLITGTTVGASDLVVDAASVQLSNTNTYNGPTYVYNSGTLSLGINNAIPNTSGVTLGNATTRGTLVTGTFTDSISQLVFSGSGGTLSLSGDKTSSAQLATAGSLTLGSNSSLVLSSPGTTDGLYRLISATSISGTFAGGNVTGVPTNYTLLYTGTAIDLQRKADQATTFTLTTGTVSRALVNTTVALSGSITNTSPAGSANLGVSLSSGGVLNVTSLSSGTSSLAPQASTSVAGTIQTGSVAGSQSWSVINTDSGAIQTTSTASGSLAVVNQRVFSVESGTIALGTFLRTIGTSGSTTISSSGLNATTANATLGGFTGTNTSGFSLSLATGTNVFDGGSALQQAVYSLAGSATSAGAINGSFSSGVSAELGSIAPVGVALTGTALDRAIASFSGASALPTLNLDFGSLNQGIGNQSLGFDLFNLEQMAGFTADLALLTIVGGTGNTGDIWTNLATFNNLAAGGSNSWLASISTDTVGSFLNTYTLSFKSANNGTVFAGDTTQTLTLTVQGIIVVPEPGAVALAGIGIAAAGWAAARRRRRAS